MVTSENAEKLRDLVESVAEMEIDRLFENKDEDLFAEKYSPRRVVEDVIQLYRRLAQIDFQVLSRTAWRQINSQTETVLEELKKLRSKGPREIAQGTGDDILSRLKSSYNDLFEAAAPAIAYHEGRHPSSDRAEELIRELEGYVESAKQQQSDVDEIRSRVSRMVEEIGVTQEAEHFKNEASDHKDKSDTWLARTLISAALTVLAGVSIILVYLFAPPEIGLPVAIQIGIGKVVVLSVFVTATVTSSKIYRSHLHNYVVNKRRANSLSSFQTFVDSTQDQETKNAVLLQATQAIFRPQETGYTGGDGSSPGGGSTNIIELAKSATESD